MHWVYELCYILIISIFDFLFLRHCTDQITLTPSLAQKLKLIFKYISTIMEQINHNNGTDKCSTLDPHGHKG